MALATILESDLVSTHRVTVTGAPKPYVTNETIISDGNPVPSNIREGRFAAIGDSLTLVTSAINRIESIQAYMDDVTGETADRSLSRFISWSNDNVTYSAAVDLTDPSITTVVFDPSLFYYFRINYTRTGIDETDLIQWNSVALALIIDPVLVLSINSDNYEAVFGSEERINEIDNALKMFNVFCADNGYQTLFFTFKTSVPYLQVLIENRDNSFDFNALLSTQFGNKLLSIFNDINLNTYKGFESQSYIS